MEKEKKEPAEEIDDKLTQKISNYFSKELGLSVSLAHESFESASRLCESLEASSSNQYFSQTTANKWFDLANQAHILLFRSEETSARLSRLASSVEIALLSNEKPALDASEVRWVRNSVAEINSKVAECNAAAQALLANLKNDSELR